MQKPKQLNLQILNLIFSCSL